MKNNKITFNLADEKATIKLAERFADVSNDNFCCHLIGDLGAGKTCFVRAYLRQKGCKETIKSPTYTLMESYSINKKEYYHMDLYRLEDPEELDFLGIRDMDNNNCFFIEWPDHGINYIIPADIVINIRHDKKGRTLSFTTLSPKGINTIKKLTNHNDKNIS